MDAKEVRMRSIEAVAGTGVREPERLIRDAAKIEEWVMAAPEPVPAKADKARAPA